MSHNIIERIKETIGKYRMLKKGDVVAAGVSGGLDSMSMLHVLNILKGELALTIIVCHLNHNLRGEESRRDFSFVKKAAKGLGLVFEGRTLKPGELRGSKKESLQAAARELRYRFLEDIAARYKAKRIAIGHILNDQAETVLMRFIKGSGISGLTGIPPVRGKVIRPLIEIKREELEGFTEDLGIEYVEDSSNLSPVYLRNEVRLNLMPFIEKNFNPNIVEACARTARILKDDDEFLRKAAKEAFSEIISMRGGSFVMDRTRLLALHPAVSSRVFLNAADKLKKRGEIYSCHIDSFHKVVKTSDPGASVTLPNGLILRREYERLILEIDGGVKPGIKPFDSALKIPGTTVIKGLNCSLKSDILKRPSLKGRQMDEKTAFFDYDALPKPVKVRSLKAGDRIAPFGMHGHKKLKEIFIEKKIPRGHRRLIPLLYAGEDLLWAAGVKRSDLYRVSNTTKRVLKVEFRESGK